MPIFNTFLPVGIQWGEQAAHSFLSSNTTTNTGMVNDNINDNKNNHKIIPKTFQVSDDPGIFQRVGYQVSKVLPGPANNNTDLRIALGNMKYDMATRNQIRDHFQAQRPWNVTTTEDDVVPNKNKDSILKTIVLALKDTLGYVVFTYQDLYHYISEYRAGHWTWTNLVSDVAFLWRLSVTILITLGLMQIATVTESLFRLADSLLGMVMAIFGFVGESLNTVREFVMTTLFNQPNK